MFMSKKHMTKKSKNKIFLFPLTLAVILFASIIIIFSPVGKKSIIKIIPTVTPTLIPSFDYICPKNEWINCMPGPDIVEAECQQDYLNWVKINCPKFKGVAY